MVYIPKKIKSSYMSLIVPHITARVSFREHPVKGHEYQLAVVISEGYFFNSILWYLFYGHSGHPSINCSISFLQSHHTGQPPSSGDSECRSRQESIWGKHLYHRGKHLRNAEFKWVLLLCQQWAAILTISGLSLFKAPLHFWLWYFPFWKLWDMPPEKFGISVHSHPEKCSCFPGIISSQGDSTYAILKCTITSEFRDRISQPRETANHGCWSSHVLSNIRSA